MASAGSGGCVHYKFKSQNSYDTIPFAGVYVSVGQLKQLIAERKGLDKESTAELLLINAQNDEEYNDDQGLIWKNSSVIVRRVPKVIAKAIDAELGGGEEKKRIYVKPPDAAALNAAQQQQQRNRRNMLIAKREKREQQRQLRRGGGNDSDDNNAADDIDALGEEGRDDVEVKEMIQKETENWESERRDANNARIVSKAHGNPRQGIAQRGNVHQVSHGVSIAQEMHANKILNSSYVRADGPPGPGYVCKRCNVPGHWITDCPQGKDSNLEVVRMKTAYGIPQNRLEGTDTGVLVGPTGESVEMKADETEFDRMMGFLTGEEDEEKDETLLLANEEANDNDNNNNDNDQMMIPGPMPPQMGGPPPLPKMPPPASAETREERDKKYAEEKAAAKERFVNMSPEEVMNMDPDEMQKLMDFISDDNDPNLQGGDHHGAPIELTPEQEQEADDLLKNGDFSTVEAMLRTFGIPQDKIEKMMTAKVSYNNNPFGPNTFFNPNAGGHQQQHFSGPKPCFAYPKGECFRGDRCRYYHDPSITPPELPPNMGGGFGGQQQQQFNGPPEACFAYAKGECFRGDRCRYYHDPSIPPPDPSKQIGAGGPCWAFTQGRCFRGESCRFSHDPSVLPTDPENIPFPNAGLQQEPPSMMMNNSMQQHYHHHHQQQDQQQQQYQQGPPPQQVYGRGLKRERDGSRDRFASSGEQQQEQHQEREREGRPSSRGYENQHAPPPRGDSRDRNEQHAQPAPFRFGAPPGPPPQRRGRSPPPPQRRAPPPPAGSKRTRDDSREPRDEREQRPPDAKRSRRGEESRGGGARERERGRDYDDDGAGGFVEGSRDNRGRRAPRDSNRSSRNDPSRNKSSSRKGGNIRNRISR